jgi:hypothetical protein
MAESLPGQWLLGLCLILVLSGGAGIILSLAALIRPTRDLALTSFIARVIVVASIGLIAFSTVFPLYTYIEIQAGYLFSLVLSPAGPEAWQALDSEEEWLIYERDGERIVHELVIRAMIPPLLRQPCYGSELGLCQIADQALGHLLSWKSYMIRVLVPSWSVVVGSGLVWYYTRKERPKLFKALLVSLGASLLFFAIFSMRGYLL